MDKEEQDCYLNDAMGFEKKEKWFATCEQYNICSICSKNKNKVCKSKGKICGECYQDPDAVSRKLYADMSVVFSKKLKKYKDNIDFQVTGKAWRQWYLIYDNDFQHELTTDYIGPARSHALNYLEGDDKEKSDIIGDFLLVSRTIGGHVFWPGHRRQGNTINQVRGGRGIYDRIDITLAELNNYFNTNGNGIYLYYEPLYKAFKRYDDWFGLFKDDKDPNQSFKNYIDFFELTSFIKKEINEYKVKSLADTDGHNIILVSDVPEYREVNKKFKPKNYKLYIENCKKSISIRTNDILPYLKST